MNHPYFLYADSNLNDKDCLQQMLCEFSPSQKFIWVNNGFELIDFLQNVKKGKAYPCLIILSEKMHHLDGLATLELLKSDDIYCLIPVIILCSSSHSKGREIYNDLGAEVITKASDRSGWRKIAKEICNHTH